MGLTCIAELARALPTQENVEKTIAGWKMSAEDAAMLRYVFARKTFWQTEAEWKADLVRGVPREHILELFRLKEMEYVEDEKAELRALRDRLREWELPVFPVSGNDLIERGMKPGKALGDVLKGMKSDWVASNYTETRESLLDYMGMYK